jgi:hypothetical protein
MVFDRTDKEREFRDVYMARYSSWKEAEAGHKIAVIWAEAHRLCSAT